MANILFVDHVGVMAGAEWSLLDIARHHRGSCRVVLLADGPFRDRLAAENIPVSVVVSGKSVKNVTRQGSALRVLIATPHILLLIAKVAKIARGFDLIYANTQKAFVIGSIAGLIARRPVIWHLRDVMTADHFGVLHRKVAIWLANHLSKRVIANSHASANAFVDAGGRSGLVTVIHNGISAKPFLSVTDAQTDAVRAELKLGDAPVIGVFSRLAYWKGQHVVVDALPYLPNVQALVVGEALFGETVYAMELRQRAQNLGVADRVHFLGFRSDIPVLLRLCDVILQTSTSPEPFGRVVVEGMLAGRPVVAMNAGGPREIITNGVDGLLIDPNNAQELADSVNDLLHDPERRRSIAEAGFQTAITRFSVEQLIARTSEEIDRVVHG